MIKPLFVLLAVVCLCPRAFGVATITGGTSYSYNTTEPTTISSYTTQVVTTHTTSRGPGNTVVTTSTATQSTTVDFSSGWGATNDANGTTGWDYVGKLTDSYGSASAIYLGDGWVLTCSHALSLTDYSASFTLSGSTYKAVAGTIQRVGSADLVMFYIGTSLDLPTLSLSTSSITLNTSVVMVGYGGGSESYGVANIVANPNTLQTYTTTYISGTSQTYLAKSNSTSLVTGDSGGAAFYYDGLSGAWVLSGVLEAVASSTSNGTVTYYNYSIDVDTYAGAIQTIMAEAVPEPAIWALTGAGAAALIAWRRRTQKGQSRS